MANRTIDTLNCMFCGPNAEPSRTVRHRRPSNAAGGRVAEVHSYLIKRSLEYVSAPAEASTSHVAKTIETNDEPYETDGGMAGAVPLRAHLLSLPATGGTFDVGAYLGPELLEYVNAEGAAMVDPLIAELAAHVTRSYHSADPDEYAAAVVRLDANGMVELQADAAEHPLGLFAVLKSDGLTLRLIVDGRPANVKFNTPSFEHTGGDDLARIQVPGGCVLEIAKADLQDFFHTCKNRPGARRYLGLRGVSAARLRALGCAVRADQEDARGYVHPRLTTVPMGWGPAPAVTQGGHEAVLYGAAGDGSEHARALTPVLDPAARLSSARTPTPDSDAASAPHALVIDDLILLRFVQRGAKAPLDARLTNVLSRYDEVGLQAKEDKVEDFAADRVVLGYRCADNVLQATREKYVALEKAVTALERRGWAQPREVERLVGKFTNLFLLFRLALSVFSAVYAFARKVGARRARVWPSVLRELRQALTLVPVACADLGRPVSDLLVQTDACDDGAAAVYTAEVPAADLRAECLRPRTRLKGRTGEGERWRVEDALAADFDAPTDPRAWRVALRRRYSQRTRTQHINAKEAGAVVDAARWATRARRTRACRLVVQSDSAVAVGAIQKGRSSRPGLLQQCRRLAAVALAERLCLEMRWVATSVNMADKPSRGARCPGPCDGQPVAVVRPRGRGQGGYAGRRVGEASNPGPPGSSALAAFWSPLLDALVADETLERYRCAVARFLEFVAEHGDYPDTAADCDYWLAYFAHTAYVAGTPSRGEVEKATFGVEHWLPELAPLPLARRCVRGWKKLRPPQPAAPMPRDLLYACAAVTALAGDGASAVAMVVSYDVWLRISEVSGLTADAVVDHRGQLDPIGRGVSVYLPRTKTGRHQAVRVENPAVANLLLAWTEAVREVDGPHARLFGTPAELRAALARALSALDGGVLETRGLHFTWHSLRHGGASRAHLAGMPMSDILLRGRWAAESSGRHYVQAGRQLLLSQTLPGEVTELARRLLHVGMEMLLSPELAMLLGP